MNREDLLALIRYVQAACPHQAFDELTPLVWVDVLGDVRAADAQAAVRALAARQRFIAPSEILTEVRSIRAARLDKVPVPAPPPGVTDADYPGWLRACRAASADGHAPAQGPAG